MIRHAEPEISAGVSIQRAVLTRKHQSLIPDLRTKRHGAKHTDGLMLLNEVRAAKS